MRKMVKFLFTFIAPLLICLQEGGDALILTSEHDKGKRKFLRSMKTRFSHQYPPEPPPYAWWGSAYGHLAPSEVCDMCGGWPGITKWSEVSETCAVWVVSFSRCMQVCNNSNRIIGFGNCMEECTNNNLQPDCTMCGSQTGNLARNITDFCDHTCEQWNTCFSDFEKEEGGKMESSDDLVAILDTCVYDCEPSLQLQLDLGFPIAWRQRRCLPMFFTCGGEKSSKCTQVPKCAGVWEKDCAETVCAPPLGTGLQSCFIDDPTCGFEKDDSPPPSPPEEEGVPLSPSLLFRSLSSKNDFATFQKNHNARGEKKDRAAVRGVGGGEDDTSAKEKDPGEIIDKADFCAIPRKEGIACGKYPLWKDAKGYPDCADGLVCNEETFLCEIEVKEEEEGKEEEGKEEEGKEEEGKEENDF